MAKAKEDAEAKGDRRKFKGRILVLGMSNDATSSYKYKADPLHR